MFSEPLAKKPSVSYIFKILQKEPDCYSARWSINLLVKTLFSHPSSIVRDIGFRFFQYWISKMEFRSAHFKILYLRHFKNFSLPNHIKGKAALTNFAVFYALLPHISSPFPSFWTTSWILHFLLHFGLSWCCFYGQW